MNPHEADGQAVSANLSKTAQVLWKGPRCLSAGALSSHWRASGSSSQGTGEHAC